MCCFNDQLGILIFRSSKLTQDPTVSNVHSLKRMAEPKVLQDGNTVVTEILPYHVKPNEYQSLENDLVMRENEMQFSRYE